MRASVAHLSLTCSCRKSRSKQVKQRFCTHACRPAPQRLGIRATQNTGAADLIFNFLT